MFNRFSLFNILLTCVVMIILFKIKNNVELLEREQKTLKISISKMYDDLRIKVASWNVLNHPTDLKKLTVKYLPEFQPISSGNIITFDDIIEISRGENDSSEDLDSFIANLAD